MRFGTRLALAALATAALVSEAPAQTAAPAPAPAAAAGDKAMGSEGKWTTKDGAPIYNIEADGKMDWFTYSGFRRYHSECHVCHGPEEIGRAHV